MMTMDSGEGDVLFNLLIVGSEAFDKLVRFSVEGFKIEHNINGFGFFAGKLNFENYFLISPGQQID